MIKFGRRIRHTDYSREVRYNYLDGNNLYGYDVRTQELLVYDVYHGLLRDPQGTWEHKLCQGYQRSYLSRIPMDYSSIPGVLVKTSDEEASDREFDDEWKRILSQTSPTVLTEVQEAYLATLVHQRVSADQLRKGVKSATGKLPAKVIWDYLGGINYEGDFNSVEDLVLSVGQQGK